MRLLTVENDYTPTSPDETGVTRGETFKLRSIFSGGWGYGINVDYEEIGMVPLDCLRIASSQPFFTGRHIHRLQPRQAPSSSFGALPVVSDSGELGANSGAGWTLLDVRGAPPSTSAL
ncbi:hypothetical protein M427DRAFT_399662 [Gonapodya prolifera JEL478]|uniref:SH3 domain-containing protein n=1 Tax=Gonapodya prolifera (strain JEL478) TaxID=1344416 RepID=A0A139ATH6_GONPJ|nr:hypothetical protein M427DRAFT_399662 [Gonapodya prolifera JEL478]|eukprot:KXS19994.1 hypothetical protein M427DRAFT_399662 [Gonapodya prolifera JEL478]